MIERVCDAADKRRAAGAVRAAAKTAVARERAAEDAKAYPKGWLREWLGPISRLRAWGVALTIEMTVRERRPRGPIVQYGSFVPQNGARVPDIASRIEIVGVSPAWTTGRAWPIAIGRGRITMTVGTDRAQALEVLVHECAHIAAGPGTGHGERFHLLLVAATEELTGRRVDPPTGRATAYAWDRPCTAAVRAFLLERGEIKESI